MPYPNTTPVGIVSIGAHVPPHVMTNFDFEKIVETSDEWIRTRSGISERHFVDEHTATSDLAIAAGKQALERAGMTGEDLDLIIVATITPDHIFPSTACLVQHGLGATRAAAFDVSAACTGFIYANSVATAMIASGQYRNALVIGAESLSTLLDFSDRRTCVLMGDGAAAVVLKPVAEPRGFQSFYLRADGSGAEILYVPAGGSRLRTSHDTIDAHQHFLQMNGSEVFKFAVRCIEDAVTNVIERAGLTSADIDYVIPHQANIRIIESAAKRIDIPEDRWISNIKYYGNTSAASIPLAMNEAYEAGRIKEGNTILIVGFGGGLTWGSAIVRW